jgi:hypothetical protein
MEGGDERLRAVALLGFYLTSTVQCMRRNAKFASPGGGAEESLLDGFRSLRRQLHEWREWGAVTPLEYLAPFLAVVRSDETSGPITASALGALLAVLNAGLVARSAPGAADAMHALVDAVTHCRFEVRSPTPVSGEPRRNRGEEHPSAPPLPPWWGSTQPRWEC